MSEAIAELRLVEYHDQISPELAILSLDSGLEKGVVDG